MNEEAIYRVRGQILTAVRAGGSDGVTVEFLSGAFMRAGKDWAVGQLEENIQYLEDKGFVRKEFRHDPFSKVERWIVSLTAKGLDLIQRTIPSDPGVELVC